MKPIIRWTIGKALQPGFKCLSYSVNSFRKIYGDRFDYYVLYNSRCPNVDANVVKQEGNVVGPAWKLVPPRLSINSPEIFMDNDLVLVKRLPEIDMLLDANVPFMTEGLKRNFGKYERLLKPKYILNSGLFGLPSGFDFQAKMESTKNNWDNYYDEQGFVAWIMTSFPNLNIIPRKCVGICRPDDPLPDYSHGIHFCGLNHAGKSHKGWAGFMKGSIKLD